MVVLWLVILDLLLFIIGYFVVLRILQMYADEWCNIKLFWKTTALYWSVLIMKISLLYICSAIGS